MFGFDPLLGVGEFSDSATLTPSGNKGGSSSVGITPNSANGSIAEAFTGGAPFLTMHVWSLAIVRNGKQLVKSWHVSVNS